MTFYEQVIATATGLSDIEKIRKVENYMRHMFFHSTLSWQEMDDLVFAARESAKDLAAIKWDFK
jgi:hypothetical protein